MCDALFCSIMIEMRNRSLLDSGRAQLCFLCIIAFCLSLFRVGNDVLSWGRACFDGWEILQISRFLLIFAHTFLSIFLLLLLVVRSRVMAYVVLPFAVLTWGGAAYVRLTMGHCLYSEIVIGALETSWREFSDLLDWLTICVGVAVITAGFGLGYVCRCFCRRLAGGSGVRVWGAAILYFVLTIAPVPLLSETCPRALVPLLYKMPTAEGEAREAMIENMIVGMANEDRMEFSYRVLLPFYRQLAFVYYVADYYFVKDFRPAEAFPSHLTCEDDVVVVLFIGESYRAKNASWNGYYRETLPKLSSLRENTVNFPFFKSYATSTISSIYGMISDASCVNRNASYTSFLSIMAKHGFTSSLVLCRTTRWDLNPKIIKLLDNKIGNIVLSEDSSDVIADIEQIASKPGRHVILVEDGTGHAPYHHEACFNRFGNESPQDSYDNALLQTDDLLFGIAEKLKGRKAVMLYCSDHGQSFGEQGLSMHGGPLNIVQQRHVFSFVWYSDSYAMAHQDKINNMQSNANRLLSHDDIYLSILSLAGIKTELPISGGGDFTTPLERPVMQEFELDEN